MSTAKHTPGPWTAHNLAGKPVNDPSIMSAKHCVATVWINDISRKQAVANACLIAAAPELLAALNEIVSKAMNGDWTLPSSFASAARNAIAKADAALIAEERADG